MAPNRNFVGVNILSVTEFEGEVVTFDAAES